MIEADSREIWVGENGTGSASGEDLLPIGIRNGAGSNSGEDGLRWMKEE